MSTIDFVSRRNVDEQKWDLCVQQSTNSLPYALSWYLDSVAENWDGLVLGNYEAVMPLVWLRKFGVPCLYQPYYCQQLGIFGQYISAKTQTEFLKEAQKKFPYIHINLNPWAEKIAGKFKLQNKKNLLLNLNTDFASLQKRFSENHRRNIAKAIKTGFVFEECDVKTFQSFYLKTIDRQQQKIKPSHEKIFKKLTEVAISQNTGACYVVCSKEKNLLAAAMLLFHQTRIINIVNVTSADGKKSGASHLLFGSMLQKFASQNRVFDFEGSSISSVARFYEGFGATNETFFLYKTHLLKSIRQRWA